MLINKSCFLPAVFTAAVLDPCLPAQTVRFDTTVGGIDVVLTPDITPLTVANFMNYVNSGHYNKTIIHRSLNSANYTSAVFYLIQGGGYILGPGNLPTTCNHQSAPTFVCTGPVVNEFKSSNVRGTIAMAQYGSDPNSATDQWFINTSDNSGALDSQNFAVFGKVANDASLAMVDAINALPTYSYNAGTEANFANLPLQNYTAGLVRPANYIFVNSIAPIQPAATAAGMLSAASFASSATNGVSPGEILTLFGSQLGPTQPATLTVNSSNQVDTTLQGTQVTFNGVAAPVIFTASNQIAFVAPYSIANSSTVDVVVSYLGVQTSKMTFKVVPVNPALFYNTDSAGNKNAAMIRYSDGSIIASSNPASRGDVLELYGEGYGVSTPALADGTVIGTTLPVPSAATTLLIDGQAVPTSYAGAAPGDVNGVLQINFVVPQLSPGSHQIQIKAGSVTSPSGVILQTK